MTQTLNSSSTAGGAAVGLGTRWHLAVATACAALGFALLALNLYGLTQSLRGPQVATGVPGQLYEPPIAPDEALTRLQSLPTDDRRAFALQAAETIGAAMSHVAYSKLDEAGGAFDGLNHTVPVWENYLLYALRYLKPDTYRIYEYCSWRHAVTRGIGQCGQKSMAVTGFLLEHGYRTAFIHLPMHVLATAEVAPGEWYVLDPDFRAYLPHDIHWLIAHPEVLRQGYAHSEQVLGQFDRLFLSKAPEILEGGPHTRYPRACAIEQVAYVAKWALPAVLLGGALLIGWRRRLSRG